MQSLYTIDLGSSVNDVAVSSSRMSGEGIRSTVVVDA
jgi:hypothetical protein